MPEQAHIPPEDRESDMAGIYKDLRASLMRFASRYFWRPQEVEDVVQEAFVKVIEAQHEREIREPRSYLFKTARNLAISELRSGQHRLTDTIGELLPELDLLQTPTLEQEFESRQRFDVFCRAVRRLPAQGRRVYILRRVYGYTQKETAEYLGITVKTVEAHQAKAMVRCADYMAEEAAIEQQGNSTVAKQKRKGSAREHSND